MKHSTYNINADERDQDFLTRDIVDRDSDAHNGDNVFANAHSNCTNNQ